MVGHDICSNSHIRHKEIALEYDPVVAETDSAADVELEKTDEMNITNGLGNDEHSACHSERYDIMGKVVGGQWHKN